MSGPEAAYAASQIGSAFLGGLMAPDPQQATSFRGKGSSVDPISAMTQANKQLTDFANFYQQYMQQPVSLPSSFVQQPGGPYWGNSLPMTFGVSASDPATWAGGASLLTKESPFQIPNQPRHRPGELGGPGNGPSGGPEGTRQGVFGNGGGAGWGGGSRSGGPDDYRDAVAALELLGLGGRGRNNR